MLEQSTTNIMFWHGTNASFTLMGWRNTTLEKSFTDYLNDLQLAHSKFEECVIVYFK